MKSVRLLAALVLSTIGLAGCGDGSVKSPAFTAVLLALSIDNPANSEVAAGRRLQLLATGEFSTPPGTPEDVVDLRLVTPSYSVDDPSVARIEGSELVGLEVGTVTVTATLDGVSSPSVEFEVTAAVLEQILVTPVDPAAVPSGLSQDFTAMGIYSDDPDPRAIDETVTWESSAPGVADVSPVNGASTTAQTEQGLATGVVPNPNTATISASAVNSEGDEIAGSSLLTVGAPVFVTLGTIEPPAPSVALGRSQQFTAQGERSDGSTMGNVPNSELVWSSLDPGTASVNDSGLAQTLLQGTARIRAALVRDDGQNVVATMTVTPPVLTRILVCDAAPPNSNCPEARTIPMLSSQSLYAQGIYTDSPTPRDIVTTVAWESDSPLTVSVSPATGASTTAQGLLPGESNVSASSTNEDGDPVMGSVVVTVTSLLPLSMTAVAPADASVEQRAAGSALLSAGQERQFAAFGIWEDGIVRPLANDAIEWTSSAPSVAITDADGLVSGLASGDTRIEARLKDDRATEATPRDGGAAVRVAP